MEANSLSLGGDDIDEALINTIAVGATDTSRVTGYTHNFYRYPARFSPQFVRSVIETFSEPGDLVYDPFMGGGTSLVEAHALGRRAAGNDISSLAAFVSNVKTTLLESSDCAQIKAWSDHLHQALNVHKPSVSDTFWEDKGYHRNLDNPRTWRIRKLIEQAVTKATELQDIKQQRFARCVILKTAQWALDGRKIIPTASEFRNRLLLNLNEMLNSAREFREAVIWSQETYGIDTDVQCFHTSATNIAELPELRAAGTPKLVVTSPPYPGIHVLYHRWQVDGRKETPAPFWIADKMDGAGLSFYTMGDRKQKELITYFDCIKKSFSSLRSILEQSSMVVQMVAFSEPNWQLPKYLETMATSGYREVSMPSFDESVDGRLWREVPNRKWHAQQKGNTSGSQEVVLFHRPMS